MTYTDQSAQIIRISDFSPGVMQTSLPTNYPIGPVGSAAHAFRCYAKPGAGLAPLPTYQQCQNFFFTNTSGSVSQSLSLIGQLGIPTSSTSFGEDLVSVWMTQQGAASSTFIITRGDLVLNGVVNPTSVYSATYSSAGLTTPVAPCIAVFQDPGNTNQFARVVLAQDIKGNKWVTVPDWHTPATPVNDFTSGTLPVSNVLGNRMLYHENRAVFFFNPPTGVTTAGFQCFGGDEMWVSNIFNIGTITEVGVLFPEMGNAFLSWGSVSTGELVLLYDQGGAVIVNGDLFAPTSVIKLPAVQGASGAVGPGVSTAQGLIYVTASNGAWVWNGGNDSQKISANVPDDQLKRFPFGIGQTGYNLTGHDVFSQEWVCFPNNWVYSLQTQSWYQIEDPSVLNFQLFSRTANRTQFIYASPGTSTVGPNGTNEVDTYIFDRTAPSQTYEWLSNAMDVGVPNALVTLVSVEVVVSNTSSSPCTVTITPTSPTANYPNNPQAPVFTIPAHVTAWRGAAPLGYTDYNVQIKVNAVNTSPFLPNPAPIIHEINLGYTTIEPSMLTGV